MHLAGQLPTTQNYGCFGYFFTFGCIWWGFRAGKKIFWDQDSNKKYILPFPHPLEGGMGWIAPGAFG